MKNFTVNVPTDGGAKIRLLRGAERVQAVPFNAEHDLHGIFVAVSLSLSRSHG